MSNYHTTSGPPLPIGGATGHAPIVNFQSDGISTPWVANFKNLQYMPHTDVEWAWFPQHDAAICKIKDLATRHPVLRYYEWRSDSAVWCKWDWPWSSPPTEWTACSFCRENADRNRAKVCTNLKRMPCNCVWKWQIWSVPSWQRLYNCSQRPQATQNHI